MAKAANEPAQRDEHHHSPLGAMVWRVFSLGSTLVATRLATTLASKSWKLATGKSVPLRGDYDNAKTRDVVAFTALSGMIMAGTKVAAERKAAEYYRQSTGYLPSALEHRWLMTRRERRAHRKLVKAMTKAERATKDLTS
ncbi:MAG TPA: DUF4235 domain-containing protein [Intrasporangium sp.]|nr:DUF4235 domain-containing protein [Intrasporangium sp.]